MWIVFSVFVVLWILSVNFYMPFAVVVLLFAAMITSAAVALVPGKPGVRGQ